MSLDSDEEFQTLSYVWGERNPETLKTVEVSGHPVRVTPNLFAALQRLRHPTKTRTIWIDQLCINQQDNGERASQVAMMREIYKKSSGCIVWLGELDNACDDFTEHDAQVAFDFINYAAYPPEMHLTENLPVLLQDSYEGEQARNAFAAFSMYGNPWWSRIWTIQEAIIPVSAEMIWGTLSISRDAVFRAAYNLIGANMVHLFSTKFRTYRNSHTPLLRRMLYPIHGFRHYKEGEPPLDLLMRWRHRDSTDPRDKVYGLMGLLPVHVFPTAAPCSYEISASALFEGVTVDLIREEGGLRPLLGSAEMPHVTPGLASWAIDFACTNRVGKRQLKWWGHSHRYKKFSASGEKALKLDVTHGGNVLGMQGVFIDRVSDVGAVYMLEDGEAVDYHGLLNAERSAQKLLERYLASRNSPSHYVNGQTWRSVFWRTMIGDWIMKEYPVQRAQDEHAHAYDSLMQGDTTEYLPSTTQSSIMPAYEPFVNTSIAPPAYESFTSTPSIPHRSPSSFRPSDNLLYESACGMLPDQAFFITEKGYIGIGPPDTRPGDQVWVLFGGQVPFVMREKEKEQGDGVNKGDDVTFVGDAYVHGIMDGEAVKEGCEQRDVWVH
jgi:hypothetical protein